MNFDDKIAIVIPARAGSKGLKDKNKIDLAGRPLFAWSVEAAKYSGLPYWVSTNDADIVDYCGKNDIPYVRRPNEYAMDNSHDRAFLLHLLDHLYNTKIEVDKVVNLRPTSPIRFKGDITDFINQVRSSNNSVRSVIPSDFPVQKMWFYTDESQELSVVCAESYAMEEFNMPRQKLRTSYKQTGTFDSYMVDDIRGDRLNGETITGFIQQSPMVDIDSKKNFEEAARLIEDVRGYLP